MELVLRSLIRCPAAGPKSKTRRLWPALRGSPRRAVKTSRGPWPCAANRRTARLAVMNSVVVIPARMASTRLPGKPLADIAGKPMIAWMVDLARAAKAGPVLVAAAETEVADAARKAGAETVMTDPTLPSGSDRVHAAPPAFAAHGRFDVAVNLQGDMPTMRAEDIARAVAALKSAADIATLVSPSSDVSDRNNPNVVKAIRAADGRCLAFTRAPAPWGEGPVERHVGIYVYRRDALARFVASPPLHSNCANGWNNCARSRSA